MRSRPAVALLLAEVPRQEHVADVPAGASPTPELMVEERRSA